MGDGLVGTLLLRNSWGLLLCYTLFLRVRYAQNLFVRHAVQGLGTQGGKWVNNARVPDGAKNAWNIAKDTLNKVPEATSFLDALANDANAVMTQQQG